MIDSPALPDHFWSRVTPEPNTGCWLWVGRIADGYGRFSGKGSQLAHKRAYEALVGPVPEDLQLDHLCRTRCCVNPDHLEPVTSRENCLRGFGPPGLNAAKTHCPAGHAYEGFNLMPRKDRPGGRECRACTYERNARYKKRKRQEKRCLS